MCGKGRWILVLWALLGGFRSSFAQDIQEIETLVNHGEPAKAYELAQQLLPERAGEPQFDFWFGLAALENGKPQEAVFAFERALEAQPWNHRLRLELARAYFLVGNYERAKALFETVLAADPPPQVKENIQKFFELLNRGRESRTHSVTKTIELRAGTDSNVNSGTEIRTVTLPVGISLPLSDSSRETSDDYLAVALNMDYAHLIDKQFALFAGLSLETTHNSNYSQFATNELGLRFGTGWNFGSASFRIPVQWQWMELGRQMYRQNYSLGLEWSQMLAGSHQIGVFAQTGRMRYPDQPTNDVTMLLGGGGWGYRIPSLPVMLTLSAYVAQEDAELEHLGRKYSGVRAGGQYFYQQHQFDLSWLQQQSNYAALHQSFGVVREDDYTLISFSWTWRFVPNWQIAMTVEAGNNKANISLYSYDRNQTYLTVKYSF